jgi:hypothetical protein
MAITIDGTGTISGVSVGGLPDGIVDTDMLASNAVTSALLPAGSVVQIAQGSQTGSVISTTSTSKVTFGASASITPKSSSNSILIIATGGWYTTSGTATEFALSLDRSGTVIGTNGLVPIYETGEAADSYSITYWDSPSTTSSLTYTVKAHRINSGNMTLYNGIRSDQASRIFLIEFAQ